MSPTQKTEDKSTGKAADPSLRSGRIESQRAGLVILLRGGPLIALSLMMIIAAWRIEHFADFGNIKNLGQQNAHIAILAVGQTMVIIGAGIDLSVGAVMAVSASVASVLATQQIAFLGTTVGPINIWVAIVIGLVVGVLCGFINGVVITKGRIPDFIATLAMSETARGIALLVTGGLPIPSHLTAVELKGSLPEVLIWMGGKSLWGIPTGAIFALFVAVAGWVIMSQTGLGRAMYAVGGNKEAARVSGINVDRTKIATYTITGLMAAVAGMVLTGRMNSANALMGTGDELKCIAAVVIGGANLFGGQGSVIGSLIGAAIMGVLGNSLNLANVSAFLQRVIIGVVIVVVVLFDQWRWRKFGA